MFVTLSLLFETAMDRLRILKYMKILLYSSSLFLGTLIIICNLFKVLRNDLALLWDSETKDLLCRDCLRFLSKCLKIFLFEKRRAKNSLEFLKLFFILSLRPLRTFHLLQLTLVKNEIRLKIIEIDYSTLLKYKIRLSGC